MKRGNRVLCFPREEHLTPLKARRAAGPHRPMCGCHSSAGGGNGRGSPVSLLLLVPTGITALPDSEQSTAARGMLENGCSQQTETGLWVEHKFRTKAWVSPLRQGLKRKERKTIQERRREVQRHPSSSGQGPK